VAEERRKRSLPETSIETTSRGLGTDTSLQGPRPCRRISLSARAIGRSMGCRVLGASRQRYPEPPSSNDRLIFDPFRDGACYISVMAKPRPGTTVAVILFATLGTCAAQADDAIRPGKWAFSAVVSEATAPPGAELRSNGLALRETECIASDDPLPPMARGPSTPRYDSKHARSTRPT
jgi:hypothetical protein